MRSKAMILRMMQETLIVGAAFLALAGCSGGPAGGGPIVTGPASTGTEQVVEADWDDIEAAVDIGMSRVEAAVCRVREPELQWRAYAFDVLNIHDQRGTLTFERLNPPEKPGPRDLDQLAARAKPPESIRVRCHISERGDSTQERAMIEAVVARLVELKGAGAVPIKDEPFHIAD